MNSSLSVNDFNLLLLLTAQRVIQSDCIARVSQRGPNLVIQMYVFNPRLRHLVAVLIQHLYSRAHSSVFQTLNFPWNRCENQREQSDRGFCFTMKEPRSFHTFLPSCDTDARLPSCSSGPYKFQSLLFLTPHFTQPCIRRKRYWAATEREKSVFHSTKLQPQIQDEEQGLRPFLSNGVFFSFCSLIYHILTNASGTFPR